MTDFEAKLERFESLAAECDVISSLAADTTKREFAWMTAHKYTADREVSYPFRDLKSLTPKK